MTVAFKRALPRLTSPDVAVRTSEIDDVALSRLNGLRLTRERPRVDAATDASELVADAPAAPWDAVDRRRSTHPRWKLIAAAVLPLAAALLLVPALARHGGGHAPASRTVAVETGTANDSNPFPVDNPDSPVAYSPPAPANARSVVLQALQDAAAVNVPATQAPAPPEQGRAAAAPAPAPVGGWVQSAALNGTGGPVPGSTTWGPGSSPAQAAAASSGPSRVAPPAQAVIVWPANGPVTSLYGPSHPLGIDIGLNFGTPLRAAASGRVSFVGGDPCCSYGYYVDIDHGNGVMTRYGHLIQPSFLRTGAQVRIGDTVGYAGSTGNSTGPHLHFEVRLHGMPVNPLLVLP